jgi:hypothetical protein
MYACPTTGVQSADSSGALNPLNYKIANDKPLIILHMRVRIFHIDQRLQAHAYYLSMWDTERK